LRKNYAKIVFPTSVAEPHHFDAAAAAPAPVLLYTKPTFLKQTKVCISEKGHVFLFSSDLNYNAIE
jgi:hypothetical protein